MIPERVEKYEIVEEIGHGGMATVYRALDTRLDRPVALKVMHPHLQGAKEARSRFAREALTVARLRHPSILEIYDYSGEDSDVSYIATELLTGPTLRDFAEAHPDIPPEIAACIGIQIARALGAAHAEGVIHRDVKPENVLLHEARTVKLTDFGIAQLVDAQSMTTTGQVLGSPGHMAPEQVEGKDCGAQSDLFSLGTVLYLLATGELPFKGKNPHQVLKQIVEGRYTDPLQVRPSIGGALRAIIVRCLEVDPAKRYADAGQLERDLTEFVAQMGIESPRETLAQYLADPEGFAARMRVDTIERLIELGERAQARRDMPLALDSFNRVLAMDDGNERVLAALSRLGRRNALTRAAAVIAGLGALAAVVAFALRAEVHTAPPPPEPHVAAKAPAPPPPLPVKPAVPKRVEPAAGAKATVPDRPRRPKPVSNEPRKVVFKPNPANVSIGVDGAEPQPFGPAFNSVELAPGTHTFKLVGAHDCCVDAEIEVRIPPGPGTTTVAHQLQYRPAGLYVVTKTPANVKVDGRVDGRSRSVIRVPHDEAMVQTHRVVVTAEGYLPHDQEVKLTAGRVETVEVALQPGS